MTTYVLIPVFNRLSHTQKVIEALRAQDCRQKLSIIVINDGSFDGTQQWLAQQDDIVTLQGDGGLWWGGAIEMGLQHSLADADDDDYILFVNNDTWFDTDYVSKLEQISRELGGAIVGSAVHEPDRTPPLAGIGPRININRLAVWDLLSELDDEERSNPRRTYAVDALSGRGTLFPAFWFKRHGTMRPRLLPHYHGDYEISMRFARHGAQLIVSMEAVTYSPSVYGVNAVFGWRDRLFSERSPANVIRRTFFYLLIGTPLQRATAPLRATALFLQRATYRVALHMRRLVRPT